MARRSFPAVISAELDLTVRIYFHADFSQSSAKLLANPVATIISNWLITIPRKSRTNVGLLRSRLPTVRRSGA